MTNLLFITLFLAITSVINAQTTLIKGAGDATFYYDINGGGTCGPANGLSSFPETQGYAMCEWNNPNPKRLADYGTNNIVAMPSHLLLPNLATFCGKKVIVTINGQVRNDLQLAIWDGCLDCNLNDGLDFSSTIFGVLFGEDRCTEGRIIGEMSWVIVDEQIIPLEDCAAYLESIGKLYNIYNINFNLKFCWLSFASFAGYFIYYIFI